jgi:hypothetical protein
MPIAPAGAGPFGPEGRTTLKKVTTAVVAAVLSATVSLPPAFALDEQSRGRGRGHEKHDDRRDRGDRYDRDRDRDYDRRYDAVPRAWRNYDYRRYEPGQRRYDAARYYRTRGYRPYRLGRNDRIYRGSDNRYYCRRDDGTTGLIVGGMAGGVLGSIIAPGDSKTLGAILGAGAGALIGREIDNGVECR